VLAVLGILACNEVGTNPSAPVAIQLEAPASPSVILGDTLRDSLGAAAPLRVTVFNYKNDSIPNVPVTFLAIDSTGSVSVDPLLGIVVGHALAQVLVVATAGSLQSIPDTIVVVDTPSVMINADSLQDTIDYSFAGGLRDTTVLLRVRLVHLTDSVPIPRYIVRYSFLHPPALDNGDSTNVQLVNPSGAATLVDTTDATGTTKLGLRVTPFTHAFTDSVVVEARAATRPGFPPLAPIRYVLQVNIH
jgi:hypothetical protein